MPKLLHHIDEIACERQHDVIFVEFHNFETCYQLDYRANPSRAAIVDWLTDNNILHWECSSVPSGFGCPRYRGEIYIDVPYDRDDPLYLKLESFLENPDETMRFEGAWFRGFTLDSCMLNFGLNNLDNLNSEKICIRRIQTSDGESTFENLCLEFLV
jgi:hypothetical protein